MNDCTATLIGNLTNEPTMIKGKNGDFCSFSVAVNTSNPDGKGGYLSNFYSCNVYGKSAEIVMNKCGKGTQIQVSGDLSLVTYKKKDGSEAQSLNMYSYKVKPLQRLKGYDSATKATPNYDKPVAEPEETVDDTMPF